MTSSTKPEIHYTCLRRTTEPRPQRTCTEDLVKLAVWFVRCSRIETHIHTHRHAAHHNTPCPVGLPVGEQLNKQNVGNIVRSVGRSARPLVTSVNSEKTADSVEMSFGSGGGLGRVGPRNRIRWRPRSTRGKGHFLGMRRHDNV